MSLHSQLLADSSVAQDSTKQLVLTLVVIAIFIPIFLTMHRKVKTGKLAPNNRRTNPHSRTYLVIIASLNVVIAAAFLVFGILSVATDDPALGVGLILMSGLIGTFSWMIFQQGSSLRREGKPDHAPSEAQKKLSRPRRTAAYAFGGATGLVGYATVGAAYDREWATAAIGLVVAAATFVVSWWLYRPLRSTHS